MIVHGYYDLLLGRKTLRKQLKLTSGKIDSTLNNYKKLGKIRRKKYKKKKKPQKLTQLHIREMKKFIDQNKNEKINL